MNPDADRQPRRGPWPFPGDSPVARARRIAHMYRSQLRALDPDNCRRLDTTASAFGETWVIEQVQIHDDDDLLTPRDAAEYLCLSVDSVGALRRRGRLVGHLIDQVWHYRFADLRTLSEKRPRVAG